MINHKIILKTLIKLKGFFWIWGESLLYLGLKISLLKESQLLSNGKKATKFYLDWVPQVVFISREDEKINTAAAFGDRIFLVEEAVASIHMTMHAVPKVAFK